MNKIQGYIPGEERFLTTKNPTLKGILRVHHFTCKVKRKNLENVSVPWIFFCCGLLLTPFDDPCFDLKVGLVLGGKRPFKNIEVMKGRAPFGWFSFLDWPNKFLLLFFQDIFPNAMDKKSII